MKNIAIDLTTIADEKHGGARVLLKSLIPELLHLDSERYYFFKRKNINIPLSTKIDKRVININYINNIFWQQVQLPFYLYRFKIDIFFSVLEILPLIKPRKIKFVTYLFEEPYHRYKIALEKRTIGIYSRLSWAYINAFSRISFSKTDFIAVASPTTHQEMVNRYNLDRNIEVVPAGLNHIFKTAPDKESVDKTLLKYNIDTNYIFSLSSDDPRNNTENVIISFCKLRKQKKYKGYLVLGGTIPGNIKNRFRKIAGKFASADFIRFINYIYDRNELICLYKGCDLYIDLPLFEGFGFQVVEAGALGVPVICSNISPLNENLKNHAVFVNPEDTEEIMNSMERILIDKKLKSRITEKYEELRDRFDWSKTAFKINEIFKSL